MQAVALRSRMLCGVIVATCCLVPAWNSRATSDEAQAPGASKAPPAEAGTRAAKLRELRESKYESLEPYRAGRLERLLLSIDKAETPSILDMNFGGFYPRIGRQSRNAGGSAGVRYWNPQIAGSPIDIHGSAFLSWRRYQLYDLQIGVLPHRRGQLPLRSWRGDDVYELGDVDRSGFRRFRIYASLRYRKRPQETFFGLGPDSRLEDKTSYLLEDTTYDLVLNYQAASWLALSVYSGYRTFRQRSGEDSEVPSVEKGGFDPDEVPGLERPLDYVHLTPQVFIDFRDEPGNPHYGFMLGLAYANANDRGRVGFQFDRFAADARGFVPLGSFQRVLALRTLAIFDKTPPNNEVPFYIQGSLGSSHTLRGYDSFRFRGEDVLLFQAEYRWEAAPSLELALFTDGGTVAVPGSSVVLETMRWNYGYGIRLKNYRAVLFRFDHAFGSERNRMLVRVSAGF